jgi:hypothetical protein
MVNYKKRRISLKQNHNITSRNIINTIEELARLPYYSHYHKFNLFDYGNGIARVSRDVNFIINIRFSYSLIDPYNRLKLDGPTGVCITKSTKDNNYELFGVSYLNITETHRKETPLIYLYDYFRGIENNKKKEHFAEVKKLIYNYKFKKRLLKASYNLK